MEFRTVDKNFDYQMKEVLKKMKKEAIEDGESFDSNYLWKNRERLGELVFEATDDFLGIDELIEKINIK